METLTDFKRWAKQESHRRGIICHFYIVQRDNQSNQKQYYDKLDYAYFNLLSDSKDWLVKGTTGHGITSKRGKRSQVPCLNCFAVDEEFVSSLRRLIKDRNEKFELGILLNKRKLNNLFDVIDVSTGRPNPVPPPNRCHWYDNPRRRMGVLNPFNFCNVVRVEVPGSQFQGIAIARIPSDAMLGLLVRRTARKTVLDRMREKGLRKVKVFGLL